MQILTVDNECFVLNKIPDQVDEDLRFSVLDNSDPNEPDFCFMPLIYLESFSSPSVTLEIANKKIKEINTKGVSTHKFIKRIELAYEASDIIVSRAGAIAISELCVLGKPTILIPSPNVAENHQYKNAQSLVNKNAALLVKDSDANNKLVEEIIFLKNDPVLMQKLAKNIKKMEYKDASNIIAKHALKLV